MDVLTIHLGVLWCLLFRRNPDASLATVIDSTLSLVTAAAALSLRILEPSRCVKSSGAVLVYLACSLAKDLLELRVVVGCSNIGPCFFIRSKIFLEGIWLTSYLWVNGFFSHHSQQLISTPEEAAGIFGQVFFWWMHPVLREGYSTRILRVYPISTNDFHQKDYESEF